MLLKNLPKKAVFDFDIGQEIVNTDQIEKFIADKYNATLREVQSVLSGSKLIINGNTVKDVVSFKDGVLIVDSNRIEAAQDKNPHLTYRNAELLYTIQNGIPTYELTRHSRITRLITRGFVNRVESLVTLTPLGKEKLRQYIEEEPINKILSDPIGHKLISNKSPLIILTDSVCSVRKISDSIWRAICIVRGYIEDNINVSTTSYKLTSAGKKLLTTCGPRIVQKYLNSISSIDVAPEVNLQKIRGLLWHFNEEDFMPFLIGHPRIVKIAKEIYDSRFGEKN